MYMYNFLSILVRKPLKHVTTVETYITFYSGQKLEPTVNINIEHSYLRLFLRLYGDIYVVRYIFLLKCSVLFFKN